VIGMVGKGRARGSIEGYSEDGGGDRSNFWETDGDNNCGSSLKLVRGRRTGGEGTKKYNSPGTGAKVDREGRVGICKDLQDEVNSGWSTRSPLERIETTRKAAKKRYLSAAEREIWGWRSSKSKSLFS